MSQVWEFALLGIGAGAVYALLGQGVVAIFRGSGVLNLSHGVTAMVSAFLFNELNINKGWKLWQALVVCLLLSAAIGGLTDQLLLRRLRRSSPLTRLIATLAVLVLGEGIGTLIWGATPIIAPPIFPTHPVDVFGSSVTSDRLWLLLVAVALTGALTLVWRYTRIGWITEAVAENQRGAAALGRSPELVSSLTWAFGSLLAGLAGILIAPISQLSVTTLVLLVIPALAAALIGGFRSFPATLLGGLIVGIGQSETGEYVHFTGASDALPLLLIVLVLVFRGSALPLRGHVFDRLPEVGLGRVDFRTAGPAVAAGLVVVGVVSSSNWLSAITATFAVGIVLLSLVVVIGYAGQLSLAQYALAGVGALISSRLVASAGVPFIWSLILGTLAAMVVGIAFALPALRTRGVNLAIITLSLGLAVQSIFFNNATFTGETGISVGSINLFGWNIDPTKHPGRYAGLAFVLFVVGCLVVANVRRGGTGRRLLAVRANERAAAATGVNVVRAKLQAFAIAGALAGLGGILIGFESSVVTFGNFSPFSSIQAVAWTVVGSVGYIIGALIGAVQAPDSVSAIISQHWQNIFEYLPIIGGVGLGLVLIFNQDGIAAANLKVLRKFAGKLMALVTVGSRGIQLTTRAQSSVRVVPKRLQVEQVTVRYGQVVAVSAVDLHVDPGEVVALIGPNGAGKTSLMDALTAMAHCEGRVVLDGVDIGSWSPNRRARAGVVRTFQALELFEDMTVLENLQVAADAFGSGSSLGDLVRPSRGALPPEAMEAVREFGLTDVLDKTPRELSLGTRRLVAIARAVAMKPSVLLLDEPAAGLDDQESTEFARLVRRLATDWGMAVLLVEHDMDFVMDNSDRVVVMDFGRKIAEGTPAEVRDNPQAIAAYLGEQLSDVADPALASRIEEGADR